MWVVNILKYIMLNNQFLNAFDVLSAIPILLEDKLSCMSYVLLVLFSGFIVLRWEILRRLQVKIGSTDSIIDLGIIVLKVRNCLIQIKVIKLSVKVMCSSSLVAPMILIIHWLGTWLTFPLIIRIFLERSIDLRQNVIILLMNTLRICLGRPKIMAHVDEIPAGLLGLVLTH